MKPKPKRLKCLDCDGTGLVPSGLQLLKTGLALTTCRLCKGSGKGGIDFTWLVKDWHRLKRIEKRMTSKRKGKRA